MKKIIFVCLITSGLFACGNSTGSSEQKKSADSSATTSESAANPSYDPNRGEGKFASVDVKPTLEIARADAGEKVYSLKCASCHKLT